MLTVVSLNKEWGIKDKHINKSNWKFWIFLILEIFSFIVSFISHDPASGFFVVVSIFHLNELTKRFFFCHVSLHWLACSSEITTKTDEVCEGCYNSCSPSPGRAYTRLSENTWTGRADQSRDPPCPIQSDRILPTSWGCRAPCQPLPHRPPPLPYTRVSRLQPASLPTSKPNLRNLLMLHPSHFLACAPPHFCKRGEGKESQQAALCWE